MGKASTISKSPKMGKVVQVSTRMVENGFLVTVSDKNYNQKEFIAKTEKEALKLMTSIKDKK